MAMVKAFRTTYPPLSLSSPPPAGVAPTWEGWLMGDSGCERLKKTQSAVAPIATETPSHHMAALRQELSNDWQSESSFEAATNASQGHTNNETRASTSRPATAAMRDRRARTTKPRTATTIVPMQSRPIIPAHAASARPAIPNSSCMVVSGTRKNPCKPCGFPQELYPGGSQL
jgi:hypothetical protein